MYVYSSFICIYIYVYKVLSSYIFEDKTFSFPYRLRVYFGLSPRFFFPDKIRAKMKREKKIPW